MQSGLYAPPQNSICSLLKNRIDLINVPFTERGSRLLVLRNNNSLTIRLAERWLKIDPRLSGYRYRPPLIENLTFCDEAGHPLDFDQVTTYPHLIEIGTSKGVFALTFADSETLLILLPTARCGLRFIVHVNQGHTDRRGGILHMVGDIRRNVAYTSDRPMLKNQITLQQPNEINVEILFDHGDPNALLLNITPRLGFNRYIPDLQQALTAALQRWEEWFQAVPRVEGIYQLQYYYAWWIMRAGLISTRFYTTREAMVPSKPFYVGVWQWDAFFHALAYRHVNPRLAQDQFRVLLDHQREDGMLPDAVHDEGTITHLDFPVKADVTKPPILGWAAWKLYLSTRDQQFLKEIYDAIVHWNTWWFSKNDIDEDGLCEYQHPYSSGLDDSPLWDEGMPVTSPDLNTYLFLQLEALARMAKVLNLSEDVQRWQTQAQALLSRMIAKLWDAKAGVFWPWHHEKPIKILTPFSLFPLLTGQLPAPIHSALVQHLINPAEFWPAFPVPTVALNDPHYNPTQMWRGPTWVNVNYLLIEGLMRTGYPELGQTLRRRTLEMINRNQDIVEYYHPETGEACEKAAHVFGWSAALFIDLVLQEQKESPRTQGSTITSPPLT
ncbi:trehalase family glycosidase [uncultured Thermanaerothrix sp.]|uniref:amylo-alpha-1,6-glucosidase n=1 Tax=uncultured Thermanaerothrix sp. TaxID=1195149 RepID=UPI002618E217|nr:trehalase family glycosidase [uncultured Thermanaerothrix sp.]